jgi:outer membrane lipoprotein-sorting protein
MRRFALALFAVLSAPLLMGAGTPQPFIQRYVTLSDADKATLDAISGYLNGFATMKGGFLQLDSKGNASEGDFYIEKPGKMRFDYKPPSAALIVSDGQTVAVANRRLNTVDRYSLKDLPLGVILGDKIDLARSQQLVSIQRDAGAVIVGLRSSLNRSKANIFLLFSDPVPELRQWAVIDAQGQKTTIILRSATPGVPLAASLFELPQRGPAIRREN